MEKNSLGCIYIGDFFIITRITESLTLRTLPTSGDGILSIDAASF